MPRFTPDALRAFSDDVFQAAGFPRDEAALIARLLVAANLRGHETHGVRQIPRYLERIKKGHIVPGAKVTVVRETPTTALLEGNRTLGHVAGTRAVEIGIAKAREMRISAVAVRGLDHLGRVGAYTEMAAAAGMIGLVFASAQGPGRSVAPFGGVAKRLGTNPLGAAFPNPPGDPVLLDFATSTVAANKIRQAFDRGQETGEGWLMDLDGNPTRDPKAFLDGNAIMLPLGGLQGHKGYALAVIVDILGGVLSGGGTADTVQEMANNSSLFITIDPEAFLPRAEYERQVAELVAYLRATLTAPGAPPVMVPGEYEERHQQAREAEGIEIEERVWANILRSVEGTVAAVPQPAR